MWVIAGRAEMLGEQVGPGTYLHVPAGVEGCTVLYLYLREGDRTGG